MRHGTIAGHMRGAPEKTNLITERKGPSFPYEPNSHWLNRMTFRDADQRDLASACFTKFSEEYDLLISEVRDKYLHVKTQQHRDGLFDVTITAPQFHIVKSILQSDVDFNQFFRISCQMFWRLLGPSLSDTREFLTNEVKQKVIRLYGELQTGLRLAVDSDESCRHVSIAIQAVSTEVQRELDIVASWFDRVEDQHGAHTFTLQEIIDISIASSLNSLGTFRPRLSQNVVGTLTTTSSVLLVIWELMFVVLDNVHRRAKVGFEPEIQIECTLCTTSKTLRITLKNPLGDQIDLADLEKKLHGRRVRIEAGDIQKGAALDRGSGLLKMASLSRDLVNSKFSFYIDPEKQFVTELITPVVLGVKSFTLAMPDGD